MHSKKSESKMPCHVMCSEPGLKKGHTTGLVNCYWAILGPQRVVRRPACLPLPTTASGSLADTRRGACRGSVSAHSRHAGRVGVAQGRISLLLPPLSLTRKVIFISPQGRSSCHFSSHSLRRTHTEMGVKTECVYPEHLCHTSHQHTALGTYPHTLKFVLQDRYNCHRGSVKAMHSEMGGNLPKATQPGRGGAGILSRVHRSPKLFSSISCSHMGDSWTCPRRGSVVGETG